MQEMSNLTQPGTAERSISALVSASNERLSVINVRLEGVLGRLRGSQAEAAPSPIANAACLRDSVQEVADYLDRTEHKLVEIEAQLGE